MKNSIKLHLFALVCMSNATFLNSQAAYQDLGDIYDESTSMADRIQFQPYDTVDFTYKKEIQKEPADGQVLEPSITIKVAQHILDNGITRTKTTIQVVKNYIIKTVETWTTKNPSLWTATNIALGAGAVLGAGALAYNSNPAFAGYVDQGVENIKKGSAVASDKALEYGLAAKDRFNVLIGKNSLDEQLTYNKGVYQDKRTGVNFGSRKPTMAELQEYYAAQPEPEQIESDGLAGSDSAQALASDIK